MGEFCDRKQELLIFFYFFIYLMGLRFNKKEYLVVAKYNVPLFTFGGFKAN